MLLPSDVARLVLGYLQEEGLAATSQAFIHESPNLKEYAEHTTGDGTIPACVFSIFGKNLTTILNEYVAVKAKESGREVPLVMTSLWKKLDFTLNQIKSLQNSPAISASQRTRSRIGVANMARQRVLTLASADGVVCSSVSETSSIIGPAQTSHSVLSHSTPVSYMDGHTRAATGGGAQQLIHDGSRLLNTPRDSPVQVIVSEHRLNSGPISPGRRKWDTPRKRSGLSGPSGPSRSATTVSNLNTEAEPEEGVDENFPQLVIQNARDKILSDRLLQEKLAENINKILASESTPQTSKASSSAVETEQSIDEILGLQGEFHMSDDAIHDILEQTESDPAFQALFDLFDCQKTRFADGEAADGDTSSSPEENEIVGLSSAVQPPQSNDPGPTQQDVNASDPPPATLKMRAAQERKTRKSTAPSLLKKTILDSSGRTSRIENSSARLLVSHGEQRSASSAAVDSRGKEKPSLLNISGSVTQMDIDEPLHTPPPPLDSLVTQEPTSTSSKFAPVSLIKAPAPFTDEGSVSNVYKTQEHKQAQGSNEKPATTSSSFFTDHAEVLSPVDVQVNYTPMANDCAPHTSLSGSNRNTVSVPSVSTTSISVTATAASPASASTPAPGSSTSASNTETPTAAAASPASSCAPVAVTHSPSTTNPSALRKTADSSSVVSLKIIVSDSQDEGSLSDAVLNQAVSSISGDKIPTIYLSSPAKSPLCPATPKANFDEAAQAVSGLQSSELFGSPLSCKAAAGNTTPLTGTSQAQQRYIIQLPMDTNNPGLQGPAASYFFVTPTSDVQPRQVLLPATVSSGQPLSNNQRGVTAPSYSQSYSPGSALILPSPVKPVVLPVSVLGQNTLGNVQLVDSSNPVLVQQKQTCKPKTTSAATRQDATSGTEKNVTPAAVVQAKNAGQPDAAKCSSHKRILCFDSSSPEIQSQTTETTTPVASNTSLSQQSGRDKRIKPNILGGNKPKRRIEPVRCSADPQVGVRLLKESVHLQAQQKDPIKKNSRKQVHNKEPQNIDSDSVSQPEAEKKSKSVEASKSVDRLDACNDETKTQDAPSFSSTPSDSALNSGDGKEKEKSSRTEAEEKTPKPREGRTEKRAPIEVVPNVTANKENEMKGSTQEQQQQSTTPSSSASRDFSPPAVTQLSPHTQSKTTKTQSKASSLAKQAVEMLQDIQGLGSPSTPVKKAPGTGQTLEAHVDCTKTPSRQKKGKDGEGTPKHLIPPNTPDVPSCSPASEAGSENSINMAAHTLMILSRAAIARTGTPLKDSMRQEGVGEKSPTSSKNKKRKPSSPTDGPPPKKESKRSPSKKKDQERKKLIDCFPHDLDVDKFLSSLHYDE